MYKLDYENALINRGNWDRIKKAMQKAKRGEHVTTLFLGGSITQGCLSSKPNLCYAARVHKWWVDKFPESGITYVNAGIGGTSSQFGVARVKQHALVHQPDFILTEFAVNDLNDEFYKETYEGLVRKIISDVDRPALLLMNNVRFDDGSNAEEVHLEVAKHYDIPMVSMKSTIWKALCEGQFKASDISTDNLHPNDLGHEMVASVIIDFLEKVYASLDEEEKPASYDEDVFGNIVLPAPITDNAYQNSVRIKKYNMYDFDTQLQGFKIDTEKKKEFLNIFSSGFEAKNVGDSITVSTECTGLAIQYRKTIHKPAPIAKAVIDNDEEHAVVLDANFDEDWGDCLYIETVARHLPLGKHTVTITITDTHKEDELPFYLVSVIASR